MLGGQFNDADSLGFMACSMTGFPEACDASGLMGACCQSDAFGDPFCEILSEVDWNATATGWYAGNGIACSGLVCATGVCCEPDDTCTEVPPAVRESEGNTPGDPGTGCPDEQFAPNPCKPSGACCFPDTACEIWNADQCLARGGEYQGDDTECTPGLCPPIGACCVEIVPGTFSARMAGKRAPACKRGPHVRWAPAACARDGAPPAPAASLMEPVRTEPRCVRLNRWAEAEGDMQQQQLPTARGVLPGRRPGSLLPGTHRGRLHDQRWFFPGHWCALRRRRMGRRGLLRPGRRGCQDLFPDACIATNGVVGEVGQLCSSGDLCTPGACCLDTGSGPICVASLNALQCQSSQFAVPDGFTGAGVPCTPGICDAPTGACCGRLDGTCEDDGAGRRLAGGGLYPVGWRRASSSPPSATFTCTDKCTAFAGNPPSDFDGNGLTDLIDFAAFQRCFKTCHPMSACASSIRMRTALSTSSTMRRSSRR